MVGLALPFSRDKNEAALEAPHVGAPFIFKENGFISRYSALVGESILLVLARPSYKVQT